MIEYRQAQETDLPGIADVFFAAFAESVRHAQVGPAARHAIADAFGLVLAAEPEGLLVAAGDGRVRAYSLATVDAGRLRRKILWWGGWLRMLARALAGHYGIGWRTVRIVLGDKAVFLRSARLHGGHQARLLSLAVHPDAQGQGLGRALVTASLAHLESAGAKTVRLEVRPDNIPARHIYESLGFQPRGEYADGQGTWLVMIRDPGE